MKRRPASKVLVAAGTVFAVFLPSVTFAQIIISEVMYNPANDNSKRQWIELYNAGSSPITLVAGNKTTAWHVSDSSSHYLVDPASTNNAGGRGSLTVSPGAYAIITSDPATFIAEYTDGSYSVIKSAISPSATQGTITLLDDTGNTVDTVSYSSDMGGSNDGTSLQKNGSSWVAATPTPGTGTLTSGNSGGSSSDSSNTDASTDAGLSPGSSGVGSEDSIMPPPPKLFADGGSDRTVVVGADTEFRARAYDEKKNIIDFSRFHWNFGDGMTADTAMAMHRFDYPGRYVVVLDMPEEKDAVPDQIIVTVEQMKLALSLMQDGGVTIENRAGRTLDLSRWIIRSMERTFTIPERTFILAGSSLRISPRTLGFSSGVDVELAYPNGAAAVSTAPTPAPTSTPPAPLPAVVPPAQNRGGNSGGASQAFVSVEESVPAEDLEIVASTTSEESAQAAGAVAAQSGMSPKWWFGALGIAGLAAGSLALARRYGRKEWDIIEENTK